MYYVGTLEEMRALDAIICTNSGIPNTKGTSNWAIPRETLSGDYCIPVPVNGWNGCTFEQMTAGISDVIVEIVEFPEVEGE